MQLTSFTDYGLRALIYMASLPQDKLTNITEVTEIYGLSRNHMVKIINQLSRTGFIKATRGKNGGIKLAKAADQIVIGDVVRAIEPLHLVHCQTEFCHITSACRLKSIFSVATNAFLNELDKHTLADLIRSNQPLRQLLVIPKTH